MLLYDVIVIGGGASGLMAAIAAAECGSRVLLLEHNELPGKKILSTGNGRCNFTNRKMGPGYYRSDSKPGDDSLARGTPAADFTAPALAAFPPGDCIGFFETLGVRTVEKNGWCYPRSMQAGTIRRALENECRRLHAAVICGADVTSITHRDSGFSVNVRIKKAADTAGAQTAKKNRGAFAVYQSRSCILAAGGLADPKSGSGGSGYALARALGHSIIPPVPALVPLICDAKWLKSVRGVRAAGKVTLELSCAAQTNSKNFRTAGEELSAEGELQFTEYGISGIPVFQVSRFAARGLQDPETKITAHLDLVPEFEKKALIHALEEVLLSDYCPASAQDLLGGMIHAKPAAVIADWLHAKRLNLRELPQAEKSEFAARAAEKLKDIPLTVTGVKDFDQAQVTAGGIHTGEIDQETMESRLVPDLYFAGEIIDVDGPCGGYNLQWAFCSGRAAGRAASKCCESTDPF